MTTLMDLATPNTPNWCPGCGNFGIWAAFKNAAVKADWNNSNSAIVAGIGCHGHMINFLKVTAFEGLHGRALPVATGLKTVNHRLNVFVFTGDGDCFAEGGNHFIHACRRNHDITILIHNNDLYALTTGQCSPETPKGMVTGSTPNGNQDVPFNILSVAMTCGATFVARGYAGDIVGLADIMIKANNHRGVSVVEILQPCVTFNKIYTYGYFQENCYKLPDDFPRTDFNQALLKTFESGEKQIPLGIFYEVERPTAESGYVQLSDRPLLENELVKRNTKELFAKLF